MHLELDNVNRNIKCMGNGEYRSMKITPWVSMSGMALDFSTLGSPCAVIFSGYISWVVVSIGLNWKIYLLSLPTALVSPWPQPFPWQDLWSYNSLTYHVIDLTFALELCNVLVLMGSRGYEICFVWWANFDVVTTCGAIVLCC